MNIWIFNHHALTPEMGGGTRHYDFARVLVSQGHRVTIFASSFHYAKHQEMKSYAKGYYIYEQIDGIDFVWLKTRPYRGNGLGRVLNMLDYMKKVQKVAKTHSKPDVIIGSSVHLFAVYAAYKIAKYFKVPFVMEVRDLWPQTLIDMGVSKWHPFILLLSVMERFLYKKADLIISNLPYAYEYIETFGVKKERILWISNGVDLLKSETIPPFVYEKETFNIVYAGAIGQANDLDTLLKAAKALERHKDIKIHIIGEGPLKKELQAQKTAQVTFYGALPKEQAIAMIKGASVLFFPLADSPVFRFGISSNKLFDYLASKKPIIFASNAKNNPVKEAGAGVSIASGDEHALSEAVMLLKAMPEENRTLFGKNGFTYVSKHFSITLLAKKLEDALVSLVYNDKKREE